MNTLEFTNVVRRAEVVEPSSIEESDGLQQRAPRARWNTPLRYALLAGVALLAAGLAITILNSISEIEAQVEMINANILASPR